MKLFFIENAFIIVLFDLAFLIITDMLLRPLSVTYYAKTKKELATMSISTLSRVLFVYIMTIFLWIVMPEVDSKHTTPLLTQILDIFYDGSGAIALHYIIVNAVRFARYRGGEERRRGPGEK